MAIDNKRVGIQQIASQIHSGSAAKDQTNKAVGYVFGETITRVVAPATTYAFTHNDNETLLLSGLTATTTINLTAGTDLFEGALLTISVTQGLTGRNLVLGTGIIGDDLVGVTSDVDVLVIKYLGAGSWTVVSNTKIVDAA